MENTLQAALGKCLESAGTLRLPLVMPYRCIAPGEKDRETFLIKYNSNKAPPGKLYQHLYRQRVTYLVVAFFFQHLVQLISLFFKLNQTKLTK